MENIVEYDPKTTPWQLYEEDFPSIESLDHRLRFLIRYAILAPSSHNAQPWQFRIVGERIDLLADRSRWLRVADADRRELYITLGCALENLLIAIEHFRLPYTIRYFPDPGNEEHVASIWIVERGVPVESRPGDLFDAMTVRRTNHKVYDGRPIPREAMEQLRDCLMEPELTLYLTDDPAVKSGVDELVVRADALLFANPEFREELGHWIGQGVFGTPWLFAKLTRFAVTYLDFGRQTARRDEELLMSSPVFGVICSDMEGPRSWVRVGHLFERIYLRTTILGIGLQPMSQLTEVSDVRRELADLLPGKGLLPQQPFRLGYAEQESGHTPRRPLEEVLHNP